MTKKDSILTLSSIRIILKTILILLSLNVILNAQDETQQPEKKQKARMSLDYTNINNNGPRLTATVKTKTDKSYENVEGVKVHFYFEEVSETGDLGHAITGKTGEAILIIPESLKKILAKQQEYLFLATLENEPQFKDTETELVIKRAFTELRLSEQDSVKEIQFYVGAPDSTGTMVPVEDVGVKIYVKRLFGLLPITDETETSDENGLVSITFPNDIPGDENGDLTIVAQIEANEDFGNLINSKKIDWGVPLVFDNELIKGELWSSRANAPYALVVIINIMIIGIWSVIVYIIFQLLKISKLGKV